MKRIACLIAGLFFFLLLAASMVSADFALLLGSFREEQNAQRLLSNLVDRDSAAPPAFVDPFKTSDRGLWYRVLIGPFTSKDKAAEYKERFDSTGTEGLIVRMPIVSSPSRNLSEQLVATAGIETSQVSAPGSARPAPPLIPPDPSQPKGVTQERTAPPLILPDPPPEKPVETPASPAGPPQVREEPKPTPRPSRPSIDMQAIQTLSSLASARSEVIFPGDILFIEVPGQKNMTMEYDVDPGGNIYMLGVGRMPVGGLTLEALDEQLSVELRQFLTRGDRTQTALLERRRYIEIRGGVNYPGWYRVPASGTVKEIVKLAGGLVLGVDYTGIKLRRTLKTGVEEMDVEADQEITLMPNDVLIVLTPARYEMKIDRGDRLFISIPSGSELTDLSDIERKLAQNIVEVDRNGYIYIPDYGHLYVHNLSTEEVSKIITDKLPIYLARVAKVHVSIIEKKHYVQILGHVESPGWYTISEMANIQMALSEAGGPQDGAVMSDIRITRHFEGEVYTLKANLYQFTVTGDVRLLTPIHENDTIFVPISPGFGAIKRTLSAWEPTQERLEEDTGTKVRIFGAVSQPGVYEPTEDMNLMDLLIRAGGNRDDADLGNVLIFREGRSTRYDLNALILESMTGRVQMPEIRTGDSVYVSFVKKAGYEKQEPKEMVRIFGAVPNPGLFEPSEDMSLLDALTLSKGVTFDADQANVMIMRRHGPIERFDLKTFLEMGEMDLSQLPKIFPSDTIYVHFLQREGMKEPDPRKMVRVLGAVQNPGVFEPIQDGDLLDVLSMARGMTFDANQARVLIMRRDGAIETFDLKAFLESPTMDLARLPKIHPSDTVYVHFLQREGMKEPDPKTMVRVMGAVQNPGVFEPVQDGDLLDALSLARGMTYDADQANILIMKKSGLIEKFDLRAFLGAKEKGTRKIPKVLPGETVYVNFLQREDLQDANPVYVIGKVNSPGAFPLAKGGMTVFQVIALAGDLNEWADERNIMIIRMANGKQQNIPFDYRKAISGKFPELNIRLKENDTVYVP